MKVKKADLLIRLGMKQDSWIDGLIQVARNKRIFPGNPGYLDCSKKVTKIDIPEGNIDGSMGDVHKYGNPHYWLDPENGKIIADQIRTQLSQIDPENAGIYTKNYTQFVNTLNKKIAQWKQQLAPLNTHTFITYHSVWNYFFKAFKLQSIGELEPLPGIPPTTKHIAKLKKSAVNQTPRPIILTANYYPPKIGIAFAQSINTTHLVLTPHVDNKKTTTYLDLFDVIIETLTQ